MSGANAVLPWGTIPELGRAIRARETSAEELARYYLDRLERIGRSLNAVIALTPERALREARLADAELRGGLDRGPLHGIPYGVKDLLATAGDRTTWGAVPCAEQAFDEDAEVVRRLGAAGAVLVGKLAMVELAGGMGYTSTDNCISGPCLNPWDRGRFTGGSSSGSGASVAAGAVPFAIGSETLGSIVIPAAFCGVSGLRPTYGRVSRRGAMALSWTMDKLGPLARDANDCGLVLAALAGHDPGDPTSSARPYRYEPARRPRGAWRLGLLVDDLEQAEPGVATAFESSLEVLRGLGSVEEVRLPPYPYQAVARTIILAEGVSAFEELVESGRIRELTARENRTAAYAALAISAVDYLRAQRLRRRLRLEIERLFEPFDALVAPTQSVIAPPQGDLTEYRHRPNGPAVAIGNLAGLPGIAVPNGFVDGLPTSLTFVGRPWSENVLLGLATAFQAATDWHRKHPTNEAALSPGESSGEGRSPDPTPGPSPARGGE